MDEYLKQFLSYCAPPPNGLWPSGDRLLNNIWCWFRSMSSWYTNGIRNYCSKWRHVAIMSDYRSVFQNKSYVNQHVPWGRTGSDKYSLLMHGIKREGPAKYIYLSKSGVISFQYIEITMEFQIGLGQHGYDLDNLTSMRHNHGFLELTWTALGAWWQINRRWEFIWELCIYIVELWIRLYQQNSARNIIHDYKPPYVKEVHKAIIQ